MILSNVVGKNRLYNYAAFVIYTDQQRPVKTFGKFMSVEILLLAITL